MLDWMPEAAEISREKAWDWRVWSTLLLILGVYLWVASRSTFWDRDEPRFARATVEMMASGNWLYPTFEGKLRPDKPILIYWLMAAGVKALGMTELAFRLPSCLGLTGACAFTFLAARRLFSPGAAYWAMVFLATTFLPAVMGGLATADGVLLFFLTGAMAVFTLGWMRPGELFPLRHTLLIALLLGGGWLVKGPVAWLPVLSMLLTAFLAKRWQGRDVCTTVPMAALPRLRGPIVIILLLSLVIFLAWAVPANFATGNEFARQGLGKHVFQRMLKPAEGHGGKNILQYLAMLPLYLPVIIGGFFPWILHLPGGLHALLGQRLGDSKTRALMWGWILPTFIVMSLIATKLAHYVLPIWPALAIIAAAGLELHEKGGMAEWDRRWLRGGVWFFAPIALGLGLALLVGPFLAAAGMPALALTSTDQAVFVGLGVLVLVCGAGAIYWQLREHTRHATSHACWLILGFWIILWTGCIPRVEPAVKHSPAIARVIHQHLPATAAAGKENISIALYGYEEPSLTFYLDLGQPEKIGGQIALRDWAQRAEPGFLVIQESLWLKIDQPLTLEPIARIPGINLNEQAQAMAILVLRRGK